MRATRLRRSSISTGANERLAESLPNGAQLSFHPAVAAPQALRLSVLDS